MIFRLSPAHSSRRLPTVLLVLGSATIAIAIVQRHVPDLSGAVAFLALACGWILARFYYRKPETKVPRLATGENITAPREVLPDTPNEIDDHQNSAFAGESDALPAAASRDRADTASLELETFPVYVDLINRQLTSVMEISQGATETLLSQLGKIDGRISDLLNFIQTAGHESGSRQTIGDIEDRFMESRDLLSVLGGQQQTATAAAFAHREHLSKEIGTVLGVIDRVHLVARQTTMLSLNVSIEAARVGDVGKGFAVIGHEIRSLAGEVQKLADEIYEKVSSLVTSVTDELQEQADHRETTEHAALNDISGVIDSISGDLSLLLSHHRDVLSRVETENENIAAPIMAMMGSMQFQDILRQQIEQLVKMSVEVGNHMSMLSDFLKGEGDIEQFATLAERLNALSASYVMDGQRDDHHKAFRGGIESGYGGTAAAKIELF